MPFELTSDGAGIKLVLAGKVGIRQARGLWDKLQPALAGRAAMRVEAPELEEMDTSIVQLLCRASSLTERLEIGAVSDGFLASLQRRGLETFFIQPSAPAAAAANQPGSRHA